MEQKTIEEVIGDIILDLLNLKGLRDENGRELSKVDYTIDKEKQEDYLALAEFASLLKVKGGATINLNHYLLNDFYNQSEKYRC